MKFAELRREKILKHLAVSQAYALRLLALFATFSAISLISCAHRIEGDIHLYPANEAARSTGTLTAHYIGSADGHGKTYSTLPSGEKIEGEYSIVARGTTNFGNVFGAVWGRNGLVPVIGTSSSGQIDRQSEGISAAYGDKGTEISCEFLQDNATGHGYGACKDNHGDIYKQQF